MAESSGSWRRLATEGAVIVGSILLAFAIDATWDRLQDEQRVNEYVVALEEEFVEARLEMAEQVSDREYQLAAVDSLLDAVRSGERSDRLWAWIDQLRFVYVFGPSQPAFEALSNSSGVDLVGSPELRLALLRYGQATEFLEYSSARELRRWEDLTEPYLLEHTDAALHSGGPTELSRTTRFDSGADRLYTDRYFQNLLIRRSDRLAGLSELDRGVLRAIDDVLMTISRRGESE